MALPRAERRVLHLVHDIVHDTATSSGSEPELSLEAAAAFADGIVEGDMLTREQADRMGELVALIRSQVEEALGLVEQLRRHVDERPNPDLDEIFKSG